MAPSRKNASSDKSRRPPATTPEGRENQLVSLAFDMAERQLAEGTASSQVLTHYLKIGTTRELLEKEKIRRENLLLAAKAEAFESGKRIEELYGNALAAMRTYQGQDESPDYDH